MNNSQKKTRPDKSGLNNQLSMAHLNEDRYTHDPRFDFIPDYEIVQAIKNDLNTSFE